MRWNVWVDDWQMQCCGEPFHVGSTVSWTLTPADRDWLTQVLGEETAATIDWGEEHHSDPSPGRRQVEARVTGIAAVHARMEPFPARTHITRSTGCFPRGPPPTGGIRMPVT
ncbi:DUF6578 domain-containing protein [Nonomuraea thailandensis]